MQFRDFKLWRESDLGASLVLGGLDLSVNPRDVIGIIGPNGCGKSTFLRSFLKWPGLSSKGFEPAVQPNEIGYVPQNFRESLFPWLSVASNIAIYGQQESDCFPDDVNSFLKKLRIELYPSKRCGVISGGEAQILTLALVTSKRSNIYLLDEPFSAIDFSRRSLVSAEVFRRLPDREAATFFVSHLIEEVIEHTTKCIVFNGDSTSVKVVERDDLKTEQDYEAKIRQFIWR